MMLSWQRLREAAQAFAPKGSTKRKIIQVVAIIVFFQGVSIAILSSHFGPALGIVSMALGILILLILPPDFKLKPGIRSDAKPESDDVTLGIRLVDFIFEKSGGTWTAVAVGVAVIVSVLLFNVYLSNRPDIGDSDMLSIILGGLVAAYPFVRKRFKVEVCFSILFIAFVVLILVIPQALVSSDEGSSMNNWYVHYMLVAPFARTLNLLGIEAGANVDSVTITFQDGSIHSLGISTACAGLYSFSIFVSAFFSFVLVFERLPLKTLTLVLAIGLIIAYLGNLFRMVVIGVVGYYHGMDTLLWAHDNVGWIIFLAWSSVFWYAVLRYVDKRRDTMDPSESAPR